MKFRFNYNNIKYRRENTSIFLAIILSSSYNNIGYLIDIEGVILVERQVQRIQVQLAIQTRQNGQQDNYEVTEIGQAIKIGPQLYLRYQETAGEQGIKVLFKITADNLLIIKRSVKNQPSTKFVFSRLQDQIINYPTGYGDLVLITHTKKMRLLIAQAPLFGKIDLDYSLRSSHSLVGDYKLRLLFKS